mgnify:CR=1 FL=1
MRQRPGAKHCSSLCSQSEGGEYCSSQARAKNPTKSCPRALAIFATCSWPSLCEQSELQCWRRNRRLCGPAQISAARALLPIFIFYLEHPKVLRRPAILLLFSERPPAFDCVSPYVRLRLVLRSVVPRPAFAKKYRDCSEKHASATDICGFGKIQMMRRHRNRHAIWSNTMQRFFKILNTLPFKGTSLPTEAALLFFPQHPPSNISKSYKPRYFRAF